MQKYLHISKKSSTFAADLGIVPSATIKYNRVMEKVEILKVDCKPRKVRIYRVDMENGNCLFMVYEGRKKVEQPNTFSDYYTSLKRCMIVALGNMTYIKMTEGEL